VIGLATSGNDLYVGGQFTTAGLKPSFKFARWNPTVIVLSARQHIGSPEGFDLAQNYPNPFNPSTAIQFQVEKTARVTLKVYDVLGQEVATLVDDVKPAGTYTATFNASSLASGLYLYRLSSDGGFHESRKMLLLK
jgi:hypothetical protein